VATLQASANRALRDAYHKILADLADEQDLLMIASPEFSLCLCGECTGFVFLFLLSLTFPQVSYMEGM
jgi:hypothetical protein